MEQIKLWILISVVVIMGSVLGFIGKVIARLIIERLDDIVRELRALNTTTALHGQDIKVLQEADAMINQRLNNHAERLRAIEIKEKTT